MSDSHPGVPNVKIIPPLVYLAGIVIGIVISIWIPTKIVPSLKVGWVEGLEPNLLGGVIGMDLRRPAIKLPAVGQLGMELSP